MKKPRLTDSDRLAIETGLRSGKTVYNIAKALSRPVTTITREIRARAVESDKGAAYRVTLKPSLLGIEVKVKEDVPPKEENSTGR